MSCKIETPEKQVNYDEPTVADSWSHRSVGMRCSSCMWFALKIGDTRNRHIGRCRRHAPTIAGYPVVYTIDWCGDHKLDETKV